MLLDRSLRVIAYHKKLLVFPIVSFIATLGIVLFFLGTFLFQPTGHSFKDKEHWEAVAQSIFTRESIAELQQATKIGDQRRHELQLNRAGLTVFALFYFVSIFLATFFNVAFYHEIIEALNGRDVGLMSGFTFAMSKIKTILVWSILAGVVGYLIKQMESRVGFIGRWIVRLVGVAWSVAAVFAIPVIICEEVAANPFQIVKSSAVALKKKWGESLIGFVGFGGIQAAVFLVSVVALIGVTSLSIILRAPLLIAAGAVGWLFFIFSFSYLMSVAGSVYRCALYLFASDGSLAPGFTSQMMQLAFRQKK